MMKWVRWSGVILRIYPCRPSLCSRCDPIFLKYSTNVSAFILLSLSLHDDFLISAPLTFWASLFSFIQIIVILPSHQLLLRVIYHSSEWPLHQLISSVRVSSTLTVDQIFQVICKSTVNELKEHFCPDIVFCNEMSNAKRRGLFWIF
jgi:hypothetical protein